MSAWPIDFDTANVALGGVLPTLAGGRFVATEKAPHALPTNKRG